MYNLGWGSLRYIKKGKLSKPGYLRITWVFIEVNSYYLISAVNCDVGNTGYTNIVYIFSQSNGMLRFKCQFYCDLGNTGYTKIVYIFSQSNGVLQWNFSYIVFMIICTNKTILTYHVRHSYAYFPVYCCNGRSNTHRSTDSFVHDLIQMHGPVHEHIYPKRRVKLNLVEYSSSMLKPIIIEF